MGSAGVNAMRCDGIGSDRQLALIDAVGMTFAMARSALSYSFLLKPLLLVGERANLANCRYCAFRPLSPGAVRDTRKSCIASS